MSAARRLLPPDATIVVDGVELPARTGETVAAALLAAGRGEYFCGMGVCFLCLVSIDGEPGRRACLEAVRSGMHIELPAAVNTGDV